MPSRICWLTGWNRLVIGYRHRLDYNLFPALRELDELMVPVDIVQIDIVTGKQTVSAIPARAAIVPPAR